MFSLMVASLVERRGDVVAYPFSSGFTCPISPQKAFVDPYENGGERAGLVGQARFFWRQGFLR